MDRDMFYIALKMLTGDRTKYLSILLGITFASLIMTQQPGIFLGLMTRTYSFITDSGQADMWVMDPKVRYVDDIQPMQDTELYRVRGVSGVEWAVPLFKGTIRARLYDGNFQTCNVIGIDDVSLIAGPGTMLEGQLIDLRMADSVIVDVDGATHKLASMGPHGQMIPLAVGSRIELNDHETVVVGIARATRTFQSQPVVYTTYSRATTIAPQERKLLSFILVKAKQGEDLQALKKRIRTQTKLKAYTKEEFKQVTLDYYMNNTGIPINFGISVLLGFLVGAAIAGQMFFNFTHENAKQFATLKAMGTSNVMLVKMIIAQALLVGLCGWGVGVGLTALFGIAIGDSILAFKFTFGLLAFSAAGVLIIVTFAALVSILKVIRLEPAIVFKG